jgi:hypothetical protein
MKRILVALMAGAAVFTLAFASAAVLNVNGNTIQAGVDTDLSCDLNGVNADWGLETTDNLVYYVKVVDIDPLCNGSDAFAKINDQAGDAMGPVVISGGVAKFTFATPMQPELINSLRVWIEG